MNYNNNNGDDGDGDGDGDDDDNDNDDDDNNKFTQEEEQELIDQYPPVFFISASKNDGIDDTINHLSTLATPTKNFVLPPNQKTSMTLSERIEELIREKLYRYVYIVR